MKKIKVIVLGGGISGLAGAYFLAKNSQCEITVIEKHKRAGGWIGTDNQQGFLFERGPRTFLFSKCKHIRALAAELGLEEELVFSSEKGRYVWIDGHLKKVPIWSASLIKSLLREWKVPSVKEDESIWDFACRRFNKRVARDFFDPMVTGIYGGDIKKLSVQACFPTLKKWEEELGSVTKGLWKMKKNSGPSLFTFKRGVQSFVELLEKKTRADFRYEQEAVSVEWHDVGVRVTTNKGVVEGDFLFSALPAPVAGELLVPELKQITHIGLTVVNLGYNESVLDKKGFGYIVSSQEQDGVLGVIFDSKTFKRGRGEILTVMLREGKDPLARALQALKDHLKVTAMPDSYQIIQTSNAFPQMEIGHKARMQMLEKRLAVDLPRLKLLGNYLYGVGVEDCVTRAKSVSESFLRTVES